MAGDARRPGPAGSLNDPGGPPRVAPQPTPVAAPAVRLGGAILTQEGEAFARASILERKERFRRLILEQSTLVTRIHAALEGKKNHRLPEAFFLDLPEKHFSLEEARRRLETAIQWGRYAELFGFEDDTDELFLEASEPRLD